MTTLTFACKTCGLDSDAIKNQILVEDYYAARYHRKGFESTPYLFNYKLTDRKAWTAGFVYFKVKTTFEDEYYVTFRADPRWPNANFYCPTPDTCQGFYELEMTIDVNNVACAPNPSVNRTAYPLVAPYPHNESFKLGQNSNYVRYPDAVSNGECGFAFGDPYVVDSDDANQVAIFNQFVIAGIEQVSFKFLTEVLTAKSTM